MNDDAASNSTPPVMITNFVRPEIAPKCFGTDIDGTFLADDPEMYQRNLDAFAWAIKNGIDIFFCTGRGYDDAMRVLPPGLAEKLGFTGYPGVYYNGAAVYGRNGEVLTEALFRKDVLKHIMDRILEAKHERFQDMEGVEFIAKRALNDLTDLTPMGITKGSGIASVLEHLGRTPDQCAYMGDAANDIEAMHLVRHSFAVANATQAVKDAAKYTVHQTNENAAFRTVMEALYDVNQN
ncbi:haloacid dehalogenase-like hydrolase family member [Babesia ovata]|uniref:Haloacid dehalogenase-like hydrolase family member n=1 Tax=Babesia ovata TaxID=189622 RepID=A0A2H6KAQ9_9APIC|nr:haloacid dehalogenase-like hydrolase family member [Babesia ovata]GBE60081.1 haloacid dehalogenase-like hydrolase family member [Babesia ovata]